MCDPITAISAVTSLLGAVSSIGGLFGGGGKQSQLPAFSPAPGPQAPAVTPDQTKFDSPGQLAAVPAYLQLSSGMTPVQQRTALATGAVSGESGAFRDQTAQNYYRDLALSSLVGPGGQAIEGGTGGPTDVERRFVEQVLGETIRQPTTASFLSALLRGTS